MKKIKVTARLTIILPIRDVSHTNEGCLFSQIEDESQPNQVKEGLLLRLSYVDQHSQIETVIDQGSEEPGAHMEGDAYPPNVPLGTDPSDGTDGGDDIIHLEE